MCASRNPKVAIDGSSATASLRQAKASPTASSTLCKLLQQFLAKPEGYAPLAECIFLDGRGPYPHIRLHTADAEATWRNTAQPWRGCLPPDPHVDDMVEI